MKRIILAASDTYDTLQEEIDAFKQAARTLEQFQSKFANNPVMISRMSTIVHQDSIRGELFNHIEDFAKSEDPDLLEPGMCLLSKAYGDRLKYVQVNTVTSSSISYYNCIFENGVAYPGRLRRGSVAKFMENFNVSNMNIYSDEQQMLTDCGMSSSYTVDTGRNIKQGNVYVVGKYVYYVYRVNGKQIGLIYMILSSTSNTGDWHWVLGTNYAADYALTFSNADEEYNSLDDFEKAYSDFKMNYSDVKVLLRNIR